MPIWGEWKITWRQVLPPVLISIAIGCAAYTVYSCRSADRSGHFTEDEQLELCLQQLSSNDVGKRLAAIHNLRDLGNPAAREALERLKPDPAAGLPPDLSDDLRTQLRDALDDALSKLGGSK